MLDLYDYFMTKANFAIFTLNFTFYYYMSYFVNFINFVNVNVFKYI